MAVTAATRSRKGLQGLRRVVLGGLLVAAVALGLGLSTLTVLFTAGGTLSDQLKDR